MSVRNWFGLEEIQFFPFLFNFFREESEESWEAKGRSWQPIQASRAQVARGHCASANLGQGSPPEV